MRLVALEGLLAIETIDVTEALTQASNLVADALKADKVDVFLYDASQEALVSLGVSQTPTGDKQKELGLDFLLIENGGRTVLTFLNEETFITGHAERDPEELVGIVEGLGIHSVIAVPLYVKGQLRGIVEVTTLIPEAFTRADLHFLEAVAGWISIILHRAELTRQVVYEASEEARRATAEELVTIIAHDLRNYFAIVAGHLGILKRKVLRRKDAVKGKPPDPWEINEGDIDSVDNVFNQLNRMVEDLLDVSRLESGPFYIDKELFDVVGLVKEIANTFSTVTNPVQVVAPSELYLSADPRRLRQAIENLLTNALNFSPTNKPVELIVTTATQANTTWAVLTVGDKGRGIDPEVLPHLFKRFVKTPGSTGLGLGLYLARQIALAHGGTLAVESMPGKGTTFIFSLPLEGDFAGIDG
ncbi:MAG: hypothetical protein BGO39_02240 [Chloroflexi bacterium 54-19]|nr:MAG: hypothetical protein BGO39_02240 [Chloroflexi bacterium 54-19]